MLDTRPRHQAVRKARAAEPHRGDGRVGRVPAEEARQHLQQQATPDGQEHHREQPCGPFIDGIEQQCRQHDGRCDEEPASQRKQLQGPAHVIQEAHPACTTGARRSGAGWFSRTATKRNQHEHASKQQADAPIRNRHDARIAGAPMTAGGCRSRPRPRWSRNRRGHGPCRRRAGAGQAPGSRVEHGPDHAGASGLPCTASTISNGAGRIIHPAPMLAASARTAPVWPCCLAPAWAAQR